MILFFVMFSHSSDGFRGAWEWRQQDLDAEGAQINLGSKEKDMLEGKKPNLKTIKEQGLEFGVEGERA